MKHEDQNIQVSFQGCNEVSGVKDKRGGIWDPKGGIWDPVQPRNQGSQATGSAGFFFGGGGGGVGGGESGIRLYNFCVISNKTLSRFWNQGSEILVQKWDEL